MLINSFGYDLFFKFALEKYIDFYCFSLIVLSHHPVIHLIAVPEIMFFEISPDLLDKSKFLPLESRFVFFYGFEYFFTRFLTYFIMICSVQVQSADLPEIKITHLIRFPVKHIRINSTDTGTNFIMNASSVPEENAISIWFCFEGITHYIKSSKIVT